MALRIDVRAMGLRINLINCGSMKCFSSGCHPTRRLRAAYRNPVPDRHRQRMYRPDGPERLVPPKTVLRMSAIDAQRSAMHDSTPNPFRSVPFKINAPSGPKGRHNPRRCRPGTGFQWPRTQAASKVVKPTRIARAETQTSRPVTRRAFDQI